METQHILETAYEHFRHGWATGEWQAFIDVMSDDLLFQYPAGAWGGRHEPPHGKVRLRAWADHHGATDDRITITSTHKIVSGSWLLVLEDSHGIYHGRPASGTEAILLRAQNGKIIEYREFFGDLSGLGVYSALSTEE